MTTAPELLPEYLMNHPEAFAGQYVVYLDNSPMVITPAFYDAEQCERRFLRKHPGSAVVIMKNGERI